MLKPYLLSYGKKLLELLELRFTYLTDTKPANSLYD